MAGVRAVSVPVTPWYFPLLIILFSSGVPIGLQFYHLVEGILDIILNEDEQSKWKEIQVAT